MQFIIWGAGIRGMRILKHIEEFVIAFVDNDLNKVGTMICGKPVISFQEYLREYSSTFVIIGMAFEKAPIEHLEKLGIYSYLLPSDCPAEYQELYYHDYLKKYVFSQIRIEGKYGVYGYSIFSLVVNEYIYRVTHSYATFILPYGLSQQRREAFEKILHHQNIPCSNYGESLPDTLFVTCENDFDIISTKNQNYSKILKLFDNSKLLSQYYNKNLLNYKNIYSEKTCFIIGTGPSLLTSDLELLMKNNVICFSMNYIYKVFGDTLWRPQYYMAEDCRMLENYEGMKSVEYSGVECLFLADTSDKYWTNNTIDARHEKYHLHLDMSEFRIPKFSEEIEWRIYEGGTVTYSCIQMANYMGFNNIILLGVDSNSKPNGSYEHFYKEEKLTSIRFDDLVENGYKSAREYAEKHQKHIYNASRGGNMDIFERIEFDSLFEDEIFLDEKLNKHN